MNPFGVPLLNTIILLSSGFTITWRHYNILCNKRGKLGVILTIILAFLFIYLQYVEYSSASFSLRDRVFGRIFYFSTGFHGLHVFFGSIFIFYNLIRLYLNEFTRNHHLGLEFSILY